MIKKPTSCGPRLTALGLFITIGFMSGCASKAQPEQPIQVSAGQESVVKAKADSQVVETAKVAEQNAIAEVDETTSIFFSLGSRTVNQSEKGKLSLTAHRLKDDKSLFVTLVGHANDNGSRSFNLAVADARVESVSAILRKLGVKTHQIKKEVSGSEKMPSFCRSEACRRKMRRVELIISGGT